MEYERSLGSGPVLDHRSSRTGRWLRGRRVRIAFWIAVVEGVLIVFHAISWWAAIAIAALVVAGWFGLAHRLRSDTARQIGWIAAVSQALVALVPILVILIGTLALIVVGVLAVVALILLFSSRD
jgi:4-amino-4-deoxy-L-arabinose transferase-like glycosyltransferase